MLHIETKYINSIIYHLNSLDAIRAKYVRILNIKQYGLQKIF